MPVKLMKPKSCTAITAISNKKHVHTKFIETKHYIKKKDKLKDDKKVNATTFMNFLKELFKKLNKHKKYVLLMDNARIHHANIIKEFMSTSEHEIIFGATKKKLQYVDTSDTNKLKEKYNNILNNFDAHVYKSCYNKSFQS